MGNRLFSLVRKCEIKRSWNLEAISWMPRLVTRPKWNQCGKCGFPLKLSVSEFGALTPKTPEEVRLLEEPVRLANVLISQLAISIGWNLQVQTFNEGSSNTPGSEIHVESDDLMRLRYICIDRQATIRRKSSTIHLDVRYEIQIVSISLFHGTWCHMKQINRGTEHHDLRFPNALGSSSASFLKSLVEKKGAKPS